MFDVNEKSYIVVYIFAYENESMFAKMDISMDSSILCNVNYFCNIDIFPSCIQLTFKLNTNNENIQIYYIIHS